ncbi:PilZ domain-containing protein [Thalassotalea litorea]|uniref:PilZ domain-containing protein n=1 Tax=Thalassotalea litorea TaxID=2020715 RepID=A0A5R9IWE1_9GAMM|nr:PilZ domain-containing protein [Thalassotalea litorea]TLU66238.1 PilZ domain-containing protein [Thalassotalea litorea]
MKFLTKDLNLPITKEKVIGYVSGNEVYNKDYGVSAIQEKRANYRNLLNKPIQLILDDEEDAVKVQGTCVDVSDGGMAVELMHPVATGTLIRVENEFDLQSELAVCLEQGKVIRCQTQPDERYLLAISWLQDDF